MNGPRALLAGGGALEPYNRGPSCQRGSQWASRPSPHPHPRARSMRDPDRYCCLCGGGRAQEQTLILTHEPQYLAQPARPPETGHGGTAVVDQIQE